MRHLKWMSVPLAVLGVAAIVWASQVDELRERAESIRNEAAELAERGQFEKAERLELEAVRMLEEAERREEMHRERDRPELSDLVKRLETLRREMIELAERGNHERLEQVMGEIQRVQSEIRELSRHSREHEMLPHQDLARRLDHMRAAIEHLNEAGLHEIAEHVSHQAAEAERAMHEHPEAHGRDVLHEILRQLENLNREVEHLRDDVNALKSKATENDEEQDE